MTGVSMLSKNYFNPILNEPAGKIANAVMTQSVQLIVQVSSIAPTSPFIVLSALLGLGCLCMDETMKTLTARVAVTRRSPPTAEIRMVHAARKILTVCVLKKILMVPSAVTKIITALVKMGRHTVDEDNLVVRTPPPQRGLPALPWQS
ncbi:hypothetical protein PQX77_002323 [Marasmius sp. AFHP31]|nr:hypothetical protein PQX77_002323 [Marasmius sp. AFHP31]